MKVRYFSLLFLIIFITSCKRENHHNINFYYWKTDVYFGEVEQDYFKQLDCKKIYIRFFDVDKTSKEIEPFAKIRPFESRLPNAEFVPVVFITNRTFLEMTDNDLDELAKNITGLIETICKSNSIPDATEIQIDCDWTKNTRNAYFDFLKRLKETTGKTISSTLRLHQIAQKKETGIPPVDKGYLMCYATSSPKDFAEENSILDIDLLKSYTKNINDYPLLFDIALPLYSWAIVANHLGNIKLINNVTYNDLSAENHLKEIDSNTFEVQTDFFFRGMYLNQGFKIKLEEITPELLHEAKSYLNTKINTNYDIVYYHLDKPFLERFSIQDLK